MTLKILFVSNFGEKEKYAEFLAEAFEGQGCKVERFPVRHISGIHRGLSWKELKDYKRIKGLIKVNIELIYKTQNKYDVVVVEGGKQIHPDILNLIKIPKVWMTGDLAYDYLGQFVADAYDMVICTEEGKRYKRKFPWLNVHEISWIGGFPIHKNLNIERDIPVLYVGTAHSYRADFLNAIDRAIQKIKPESRQQISERFMCLGANWIPEQWAYNEDLARTINRAKICLHFQHAGVKNATLRFYETTLCGALLLSNYRPPQFPTLPYFNTPKQAAALIVYFLDHDEEREVLAKSFFDKKNYISYKIKKVLKLIKTEVIK